MTSLYPVIAGIDELVAQWNAFARDRRARILVWRALPEEITSIEAFVAQECDSARARTSDLFLQLVTPFVAEHGQGLARELREVAEEVQWESPPACKDELAALIGALRSLRAHLIDPASNALLAVWLDPLEVREPGYLAWLESLALASPAELRFIVVDCADDFAALSTALPARVRVVSCRLGIPAAAEPTTAQDDSG
jgi:hypothetical protein